VNNLRQFESLGRKVENRNPKKKITIYSEGKNTETDYFKEMGRKFRNTVVDIEIIGGAGVPLTIAEKAVEAALSTRRGKRRQSYAKNDEFWAVFDRDQHPNVPEAISHCKNADINVAFSNPCFEVWLILHFQDYDRPDHHHDVQRHLETICGDYDRTKRKTTDCRKLMQFIIQAENRAEKQFGRRNEEGRGQLHPPFTTVYELTRRIRPSTDQSSTGDKRPAPSIRHHKSK
jgi:hypothetical protein